jgi:hypothetical protein
MSGYVELAVMPDILPARLGQLKVTARVSTPVAPGLAEIIDSRI